MAWYHEAIRNQVPETCFTRKRTVKSAVCLHRMVGWAPYLRTPDPEAVRRRVSAHFTVDMKGGVQQHLDTIYCAHTQGIKTHQYAFARKNWNLFKNRNPNADVVSIEIEDGGRPFNDKRPMSVLQLMAVVHLIQWCLKEVVEDSPLLNETVISHDILTTNRHQDPGDWVMTRVMDELSGASTPTPSPASRIYRPEPRPVVRRPSKRSKAALRRKILSGKRKCTFNDAVTLGWITGREAGEWSRRVWYTLRKHGYSPLAPWDGDIHLYQACCGTIMAESGGKPNARNTNTNGWLPDGERGPSTDRGLVQINDKAWPDVTTAQALDPAFAINFLVTHFPKKPHWWHGYKAWKGRR